MRATSLLASFSRRNFGTRSLKSENSEVNLFRKWPIPTLQKKCRMTNVWTHKKSKKWRLRQPDRQPERRLFLISLKILSLKLHEMIFPQSKIEVQKTNLHILFHSRYILFGRCSWMTPECLCNWCHPWYNYYHPKHTRRYLKITERHW